MTIQANNKTALFKKISILLIANLLSAIAINGFFIPSNLLSGSIGGISIMVYYLTKIPTGLTALLLNTPLFLYGFKKMNKEFSLYTGLSMLVLSFWLIVTKNIGSYTNPDDILAGAIIGGVLNGVGVGLLFKNKMGQDGLDIIATLIQRRKNISIGNSLLLVNGLIVATSAILFGLKLGVYTIIALYINSTVIDKVRIGQNIRKSIFIISDNGEAIATKIQKNLNRSGTFLKGKGSYLKRDKLILYLIVNHSELVELKRTIQTVDPHAFTITSDVEEVDGSNFLNFDI